MKHRLDNVKKMHNIIQRMNNEIAFIDWTMFVPENPTEEDMECIASDIKQYYTVVTLFIKLIDTYGHDGMKKASI